MSFLDWLRNPHLDAPHADPNVERESARLQGHLDSLVQRLVVVVAQLEQEYPPEEEDDRDA